MPHDILLQKLYGCDQKTVSWFKSYLTDRCQFVNVDKASSDFGYLKLGVPQGSILGPLTFNLFINDLHLHIKFCNIFSYANDTNLTTTGDSLKNIETKLSVDLTNIEQWCNKNRLVINTLKSNCMLICTYQKRQHLETDQLKLYLYDTLIKNVESQKILGLHIDKNLMENTY